MKLIQGTPNLPNQQVDYVSEADDTGRTIDPTTRVLAVVHAGLTYKLPSNPKEGSTLRILAIGGNVALDGNGNNIDGGASTVPKGTALDITFYGGTWVPIGGAQTFDVKANCRVVATTNQALSGLPIIDGIALGTGDRVLLVGQTNPVQNGIWIAKAGAWTRAPDMPAGSSAESAFTFISEGTLHADTGWLCTTDAPNDIVGTNALTWVQFSTFPLATNPPANVSRSAALVGVSNAAAREDHKHDVVTGVPATQTIGAGTTGVGPGIALADHVHPVTAPGNPADVTKSAASPGVSTSFARADHKHDVTTAVANGSITIGGAATEGTATTLARSDHTHAFAAPAAPENVTKSAASAGVSTAAARADHKHDIDTDVPVAVGLVNAEGTSTKLSRADHVHAAGASANRYLQKLSDEQIADFTTVASGFTSLGFSIPITPVLGSDLNFHAYVSFQANDTVAGLRNVHARIRDVTNNVTIAVGSLSVNPSPGAPEFGTIALIGQRVSQPAVARTYELQIGISGSATCNVDVKASTPDTDFQGAAMIVENVLP